MRRETLNVSPTWKVVQSFRWGCRNHYGCPVIITLITTYFISYSKWLKSPLEERFPQNNYFYWDSKNWIVLRFICKLVLNFRKGCAGTQNYILHPIAKLAQCDNSTSPTRRTHTYQISASIKKRNKNVLIILFMMMVNRASWHIVSIRIFVFSPFDLIAESNLNGVCLSIEFKMANETRAEY